MEVSFQGQSTDDDYMHATEVRKLVKINHQQIPMD